MGKAKSRMTLALTCQTFTPEDERGIGYSRSNQVRTQYGGSIPGLHWVGCAEERELSRGYQHRLGGGMEEVVDPEGRR